jgi:asparagine N-glycosylation enzyme membrane subunit Stt3
MPILKVLFDICLLRGRPQDIPASTALLWMSVAASVLVDYSGVAIGDGHGVQRFLLVAAQTAFFGGVIWLVLKLRGFPARWQQTVTALFAASSVFGLVMLPVLPEVVEMLKQGPGAVIGWQAYFAFGGSIWYLMIMTQVMRHATELSVGLSALLSVGCLITVRVLELLFISMFALPVQS